MLIAAVVVAVVAGAGIVILQREQQISMPSPASDVLSVNNTQVPFEELELFLQQDRSGVYSEGGGTQASGEAFWTTPNNGSTPSQNLLNRAVRDSVVQTVQFQLATHYKLLKSPTFSYFQQAFTAENSRRALSLSQGKPIYGPQQYTESNFLSYLTGDLAQELQNKLIANRTIIVTQQQIRTYFDSHRAEYEPDTGNGPVPDTFAQSSKAIRAILIQQHYDHYIRAQADRARVTTSTALARIVPSHCIADGRC